MIKYQIENWMHINIDAMNEALNSDNFWSKKLLLISKQFTSECKKQIAELEDATSRTTVID